MSVIIIGGGIGGLAAAIALRRVGITAHVYERAPELREVGAGLTIWSNAMKALRRLGLEERALSLGTPLRKVHTLSPDAKRIGSEDLEALSQEAGAPSICIHRGDLQRMLAEALDPEQIHVGKECRDIRQDADGIGAIFADGTEARGEALIGADGIHSVVRAVFFGQEPPRYAGYCGYRGIVEKSDLPANEAFFAMLRGSQLGFFPLGDSGKTYWFLCPNAPVERAASDFDHISFLHSIADRLPTRFGAIITGTAKENLIVGNIIDRPPRREWSKGRGTLLGDAAHPTTPNLGQGACMAIEDAVVLADVLRNTDDIAAGLKEYEKRRWKRAVTITNQSRRLGRIYHFQSPLLIALRTLMFRLPVAGIIGRATQRRLLSYEPPELPQSPLSQKK